LTKQTSRKQFAVNPNASFPYPKLIMRRGRRQRALEFYSSGIAKNATEAHFSAAIGVVSGGGLSLFEKKSKMLGMTIHEVSLV